MEVVGGGDGRSGGGGWIGEGSVSGCRYVSSLSSSSTTTTTTPISTSTVPYHNHVVLALHEVVIQSM